MYQRKQMQEQLEAKGVRLGDRCSISPQGGRRKAYNLNRYCIDLISSKYRPSNLALSYIELMAASPGQFHYRLELDARSESSGRFVLKTIEGRPFWINGLAAREAYVERSDKLYIEDHRLNFANPEAHSEMAEEFNHPILSMKTLLESDLKILLVGETGTGKSHLARRIHEESGKPGPFIAINLSSFNPNLIESELFGHKKGSFTGALMDREGAFGAAAYGTLFLDEIDSLPIEIQTKLLSFLDHRLYRRVGDEKEREIRTRLIFASGRSLENLVSLGQFRKDFYFRLKSGHTIELPSLRNDPAKIAEACRYFSRQNSIEISSKLLDFYSSLAWPGNVRQLLGHLEKKKVLSQSFKFDFDYMDEELLLRSSDLMNLAKESEPELISMQQCKINYLKKALLSCEGNISLTARKLAINEKTIRNLMKNQLASM